MTHISVKEKMREDGIDQKFEEKGNMIRQLSEEEREKGNKEVSKFIQKHAQNRVSFTHRCKFNNHLY